MLLLLLPAEEKFSQTIPRRLLVPHGSWVIRLLVRRKVKKASTLTKENRRAVLVLVCCAALGLGTWGLDGPGSRRGNVAFGYR